MRLLVGPHSSLLGSAMLFSPCTTPLSTFPVADSIHPTFLLFLVQPPRSSSPLFLEGSSLVLTKLPSFPLLPIMLLSTFRVVDHILSLGPYAPDSSSRSLPSSISNAG